MYRRVSSTCAASAALLLTAMAGTVAAAPSVWVEPATVKVRPDRAPGRVLEARLSAARNEFEAFQIVVRAPEGVSRISAQASALVGPGEAQIPASAVRFYQVGLIALSQRSDAEGATGRWPDPLIPAVDDLDGSPRNGLPFDAAPNDARALWVELLVPENAPAGTYRGRITLHGTGIEGRTVPVTLRVWGFTLPSTPTLRSYFQLNDMSVCRGHYGGDPSCGDWGDQKMDLIDRYARFALDHRLTLGNIYYERNHGTDFSAFDRRYGPLLDGTASTRLRGARLTSANFMLPMTDENLALYAAHFREKGWLDRAFDYTADEPGWLDSWSSVGPRAARIHANAPGLRTLVTTTLDDARANGLDGDIDILVPVVNFIDGQPGYPYEGDQSASYDGHVATGGLYWLYQSCMSHDCGGAGAVGESGSGYPSYMIDHSALRNRAMQWVAYRYRASGELYWETTFAYDGDAWASQYYFTGNGDGTLFYPGTPARVGGSGHTPIASQRLKMIREGMEDHEYLAILTRLGQGALAMSQAREVVPTAYTIGNDPARLHAVREALGQTIEQLLAPSPEPPPTAPPPSMPPQPTGLAPPTRPACSGTLPDRSDLREALAPSPRVPSGGPFPDHRPDGEPLPSGALTGEARVAVPGALLGLGGELPGARSGGSTADPGSPGASITGGCNQAPVESQAIPTSTLPLGALIVLLLIGVSRRSRG